MGRRHAPLQIVLWGSRSLTFLALTWRRVPAAVFAFHGAGAAFAKVMNGALLLLNCRTNPPTQTMFHSVSSDWKR